MVLNNGIDVVVTFTGYFCPRCDVEVDQTSLEQFQSESSRVRSLKLCLNKRLTAME